MADEYVDTGNTNVFTLWEGKYSLASVASNVLPSTGEIMITCLNNLQILQDFEVANYIKESPIITLPEECRPTSSIITPVCIYDNDKYSVVPLGIKPTGEIVLYNDYNYAIIHLSGIYPSISERWYG